MKYKLYWATTPGHYEDWFVIAKSLKQAKRFHEYAEGFDPGDAGAKFICDISDEFVKKHKIKESDWPSHELLIDLGGKIITEDNPRRVNFNGIVYKEGTCTEEMLFDELGEQSGVYIIRIQNTDKYKIGLTKNLKRRIKQFITGNPENLKIDYFIATKKYKELEIKLHKSFDQYRIGGEWFMFDEKGLLELNIELFKLMKNQPDEYVLHNLRAVSIQARVY